MTLYRVEVKSPINGQWFGVWAATAFGNWRLFPESVPYFPMTCLYHQLPKEMKRPGLRSKFWFKASSFDKSEWLQFQLDCELKHLECRLLTRPHTDNCKILEDEHQVAYWYSRKTNKPRRGPTIDTSRESREF